MGVTATSALCLLATLSSSFPKGISAKKKENVCNSFSGNDAANDAVSWCSSPDRTTKCCIDDDGVVSSSACNLWGSKAEYNLCEGSCQGTNSCVSMLTNAAAGSTISIKEGGCVSESWGSRGVCEQFAEGADGVVTASIGKHSCAGGRLDCHGFLESAKGNITVDIQDGACYGRYACEEAFQNAGSGSSIVIKEEGCVGYDSCGNFAENADGVVTASIGKHSCSGGADACYEFLRDASGNISVDIQDSACHGNTACCHAFYEAGSGSSITIKKRGCVGYEACKDFAENADGVVTASIGKGACSGGGQTCFEVLENAREVVMIDIQDRECSGEYKACYQVGRDATELKSLTVPAEEKKKKVKGGKTTNAKKDVVEDVMEGDADDIGFTNTPDVVEIEVTVE